MLWEHEKACGTVYPPLFKIALGSVPGARYRASTFFRHRFRRYARDTSHNEAFTLLVFGGALAVLLWVAFVTTLVVSAPRSVPLGALAALLLMSSFSESPLADYVSQPGIILIAVIVGIDIRKPPSAPRSREVRGPRHKLIYKGHMTRRDRARLRMILKGGLANQLFQWAAVRAGLFGDDILVEWDARHVTRPGGRGDQLSPLGLVTDALHNSRLVMQVGLSRSGYSPISSGAARRHPASQGAVRATISSFVPALSLKRGETLCSADMSGNVFITVRAPGSTRCRIAERTRALAPRGTCRLPIFCHPCSTRRLRER